MRENRDVFSLDLNVPTFLLWKMKKWSRDHFGGLDGDEDQLSFLSDL